MSHDLAYWLAKPGGAVDLGANPVVVLGQLGADRCLLRGGQSEGGRTPELVRSDEGRNSRQKVLRGMLARQGKVVTEPGLQADSQPYGFR